MASKSRFQVVSLSPLTGPLDARPRATELPDGGFREKQNWPVNENGRLTNEAGFERFLASYEVVTHTAPTRDQLICEDGGRVVESGGQWLCLFYTNFDYHYRGVPVRKPVSFMLQVTDNDNKRTLFACTESEISYLNEVTGLWTDVLTGIAGGSKFHGDFLNNTVIFSNNKDGVYSYDLGAGSAIPIPDLVNTVHLTKAKVVIQFGGLMILMNTVESGEAHPSRVRYSDLALPKSWAPAPDSVANFQDLGGGEQILAAIELTQYLYIFTQKSIWRSTVSVDAVANTALSFARVYTEPENFKGCLVYPDSLVSDGENLYYGARESFYTYNQYAPKPEPSEWLRQASGLIYADKTRKVNANCCNSMVATFKPITNEIFVSWPSTGTCTNNQTMVFNTKFLTGYYLDSGFSSLCCYIPNPTGTADCNTLQLLVAASNVDYALKQLNGVLFREFVTQKTTQPVEDNITNPVWEKRGFARILRLILPVGLFDVSKILRKVIIGQYTAPQDNPCIARLRVGTSEQLTDPNDGDYCSVVWHTIKPDVVLKCPEALTAAQMEAQNLIPSLNMHWDTWEVGNYLYLEIAILNADGTPAIGGETQWYKLDAEVAALPA